MAQNTRVPISSFEGPGRALEPAPAPAPRQRARRQPSVRWSPPESSKSTFAASLLQNPILERELRSRWRRPLSYIVLLAYAAALSWVAWQLSGTAMEQSAQLAEGFGSERAVILPGTALFQNSVRAQVLVALWASAMLCAPVIARERELKMLPELILANLSPAQIVRGKWLATLGFAAVLLLIPLPLQALAFMLGGVSPSDWVGAALLQAGAMTLGSALGLWCSALSDRVAGAMSKTCAGAVLLSIPLGCGLIAIGEGTWVFICMTVLCVLLSLPLLAGAQNSVKDLPLDVMRPSAVDLPASHADAAPSARRSARVALGEGTFEGEGPSAPLEASASAGDVAQLQERAEETQERAEELRARRAAEMEGRACGARRESWVFPMLRALGWHNPLVWREMRVRLRQPFFDVSTLLSIALCMLALPALGASLFAPDAAGMSVALLFWVLCGVSCALGAAQGFTREREQRMLEGLMLSTLSPRSIVAGKVAAPMLLVLHTGALPLALFAGWSVLWSVMHGANIAVIALLGCAAFALLGAACGTWLSFWCRTSAISAMGSLALLAGLLAAPFTLSLIGPRWFQEASAAFWKSCLFDQITKFDGSPGFWVAGLFLCLLLASVALAMLGHLAIVLRPKALEREGRSIMHTDLTRNLH